MADKRYVVIVGCGRFGSFLANHYSKAGSSVVVIDRDPESFTALAADFSGFAIEGSASEFAVLKQAKTDRADLFIATTDKDSVNLFSAQVAKRHFKVREVIVRVYDPKLTTMYEGTGITTICPPLVFAEHFFQKT
jgi:trk system potassium uptake protein TrkA